jgi:hypothetical protein
VWPSVRSPVSSMTRTPVDVGWHVALTSIGVREDLLQRVRLWEVRSTSGFGVPQSCERRVPSARQHQTLSISPTSLVLIVRATHGLNVFHLLISGRWSLCSFHSCGPLLLYLLFLRQHTIGRHPVPVLLSCL